MVALLLILQRNWRVLKPVLLSLPHRSSLSHRLALVVLLVGTLPVAHGQAVQITDNEELRRRSQVEAQERQRQLQAPNVNLQQVQIPAEAIDSLTLPSESPCFRVHQYILDVPRQLPSAMRAAGASDLPFDRFRFAQDYLRQYTHSCIGKQGLNLIVKRLSNLILRRGYSTTRVGIP